MTTAEALSADLPKTIIETRRVRGHHSAVIHGTYSGPVTRQDLHAKFKGSWGGEIQKFQGGVFAYKAIYD